MGDGDGGGGLGDGGGGLGGGIGGGEGDGDGGGSGGGLGDGGGGDGCGGDGGGGSRQQASLQFAVSFFFFPSHNAMHFFGFCFSPLHHLVTFFWSFVLHVFSSLSAAQSFGDGAVSVSLTLFIFKMSGVNKGGGEGVTLPI